MTDIIAQHITDIAAYAPLWGFAFILFFMTVESSFIPFPSEVVMIPAGFLAWRGELTFATYLPQLGIWPDLCMAILMGTLGSILGAWVNYWLSVKLGRPFLHRYGRYFFLKEETLNRGEEIFRHYGEIATFVCRLIPVVRQVISIPAGLSRMAFRRFTFFTGLGAGIWVIILTAVGAYLGKISGDADYLELVHKGKDILSRHYLEILIGLAVIIVIYIFIQRKIMHAKLPVAS